MTEKAKSAIVKITLNDATYRDISFEPTYINFFFGKNGAGKSTIAKSIGNRTGLTWKENVSSGAYKTLLFDRDFIESNFKQYGSLPGVFTMHEHNISLKEQLDELMAQRSDVETNEKNISEQINNDARQLDTLKSNLEEACWEQSKEIREQFPITQEGAKSKKRLTEAILNFPGAVRHDLDELRNLYAVAYDSNARTYTLFTSPSPSSQLPDSPLLMKQLISSGDSPFADFMKAIEATDWVKAGHEHFVGKSDGKCPFCQQSLPVDFEQNIAQCFDRQYQEELELLANFQRNYERTASYLLRAYEGNLEDAYTEINLEQYRSKISLLEAVIEANLKIIADKLSSPAKSFTLKPVEFITEELDAFIVEANKAIVAHNSIVSHQGKKQECKRKVWELIAYELKDLISDYKKACKKISDHRKELEKLKTELRNDYKRITAEIMEKGKESVNTRAASESINAIIKDSGFQGFYLRERTNADNVYEVIRWDGTVAENLSEGERNFIAFLYFYHLVKGGRNEEDSAKPKIVVIDDPVSSMDSGVMFIVAALVREMADICMNNIEYLNRDTTVNFIKQLFVLTHNTFFHKEITYGMLSEFRGVTIYRVEKHDNDSKIYPCIRKATNAFEDDTNYNPVQDSYAALWTEYQEATKPISLLNVMRRILEYYFLQTCGYDGNQLRNVILKDNENAFISFNEYGIPDRSKYHLATSMLSYIARASKFNDGLYFVDDETNCEHYREVFKQIFTVMSQLQHYDMMMSKRPESTDTL